MVYITWKSNGAILNDSGMIFCPTVNSTKQSAPPAQPEATPKVRCRLKKSGRPHQDWRAAPSGLYGVGAKLPAGPMLHEMMSVFTRASTSTVRPVNARRSSVEQFKLITLAVFKTHHGIGFVKRITAIVLILIALTITAKADILPNLTSITPSGPSFIFNYTAHLSSNERMDPAATSSDTPPGTFFTIYDFEGLQAVTGVPANWTFSIQMVGITPSGINGAAFDNPSIPNITFTYTGPVVHGPVDFTGFAIQSLYGTTVNGKYSSQATADAGANIGQTDQAVGPLVVASVPEPSSVALLTIAITAFGVLSFVQKRSV